MSNIVDAFWIYAPYRIRESGVKLKSIKKGKSKTPDSPSFNWDMIWKSHGFEPVDMLVFIADIARYDLMAGANDTRNFDRLKFIPALLRNR